MLQTVAPLASSVHGILQARILEWVAILSSKGSSRPVFLKSLHLQAGSLPLASPGMAASVIVSVLSPQRCVGWAFLARGSNGHKMGGGSESSLESAGKGLGLFTAVLTLDLTSSYHPPSQDCQTHSGSYKPYANLPPAPISPAAPRGVGNILAWVFAFINF